MPIRRRGPQDFHLTNFSVVELKKKQQIQAMSVTTNDIQRILAPNQGTPTPLEQSETSIEYDICELDEETKQIDHPNSLKQRQQRESVLMIEELVLRQHGYKKIGKICKTLQGVLYEAQIFDLNILNKSADEDEKNNKVNIIGHVDKYQHVVIKKTTKTLAHAKLTREGSFDLIVDEDIVKGI